ncbi:hypothetical protein [Pedobacter nutrimenti]|uniref:DUF4302 domain-containing protein n=1 Tax=Pedobacter nutrimenti TaxID=1241337 RepID=A0A318U6W0_9SPHI|nr:hypothetical protein [Pedobacter nutrimenti]PYF69392.1 hypothetical protein B0O44_11030 [Pedobacter nutrimenti]
MKKLYNLIFLAILFCMVLSCKKEALLDGGQSIERSGKLERDLKAQMHDAKDGWILFVSSLNTDVKTATPFIMKFDTTQNKVSMTSIYGNAVESYFKISASTGMPLLSFSTGSAISSVYEIGGTEITDYFFKIVRVVPDTIVMQSYRQGGTYQKEGGAILKLIRNTKPAWTRDWQQETTKIYTQAPQFFGFYMTANLRYASGEAFTPATIAFLKQSAGNYAFFKASYPTTVNNKQVEPITWAYYATPSTGIGPLGMLGYNSLFCEVSNGYSPASLFSTGPATLQKLFKTNYFLIRKVNATSIDVFALDKDGKEIITGTISLN